MKEKKKKKGGKRVGAGRKPLGRQKEAVTVYTDVSRFGGKVGARMAIYELLDGVFLKTGETKFLLLDLPEKKFPPSDDEIKRKAPKEVKRHVVHLNKPMGVLEPQKTIAHSTTFDDKGQLVEHLKVTQPVGKPEISKFEQAIAGAAKDAILKEIEAIRAEKCPEHRSKTSIGRKSWELDQKRRIEELECKLK